MSDQPSEKWRIFYEIEQSAIDEELARVGSDLEEFRRHRANRPGPGTTPQEQALDAHGLLVLASALQRKPRVLPEFRVNLACFAAMRIVEEAQRAAYSQGRHKVIGEAMDAIKRREGLPEDDDWMLGQSPADYRALAEESTREYEQIVDTVLPTVLRRYRMDDLADLFENERRSFDLKCEIGRRVSGFGSDDDPTWAARFDEMLCEQYGEDGLRQVKQRVAEIRRLEGTTR